MRFVFARVADFNPRSPCGERPKRAGLSWDGARFQSPLPVWGATPLPRPGGKAARFQSPLPVWGATGLPKSTLSRLADFNPRSPCGERLRRALSLTQACDFNPRSPCDGSTEEWRITMAISIPAPRVGSDPARAICLSSAPYFNPRSPCGERPYFLSYIINNAIFQSPLPVWGATQRCKSVETLGRISIHAPRVGSDGTDAVLAAFDT